MALPFLISLCICGVFCLTPVALYLAWLGSVNRRGRPVAAAAGWDFAALVAGLSGFLLFGGGVLVAAAQSNVRFVTRGNWEQVRAALGQEQHVWAVTALGYLVVVAAGVGLGVLARSRSLSVYNLDRGRAEAAVDEVLAEVGVPTARFGNVWPALVRIDAFDGLRHVTLTLLPADPRLAEEIERGLRKRLAALTAADNPAATWLVSAAVSALAAMLACLLLVAYFLYLAR